MRGNDAMVIKGTLGTGGDFTSLPTYGYVVGWSYKIITAGTYAGYTCEVGDLIYATNDGPLSGSSVVNSDWSVIQSNIVGAISASTGLTANQLVVGNSYAVSSLAAGSNGQVLKMINGKPGWSTDNNDNTTYTFTSGNGGTFTVMPSNGSIQTISIGTPALANALNLSGDIGSNIQPVYFDVSGVPEPIAFTINSNVPANAKFTDTTYTTFGRSTDGLVPHPTTTTSTRFLREDGSWVVPTNTTYSLATTSKNGLLRQLDGNRSHYLRGDGTWQTPPVTSVNGKTGAVTLSNTDVGAVKNSGVRGEDGNHQMAMSWNGNAIIVGVDNNAAVKTLVTTDSSQLSDSGFWAPYQSTNWDSNLVVYIRKIGHIVFYEFDLTAKFVLNCADESNAKLVTYNINDTSYKPNMTIYKLVTFINGSPLYFKFDPSGSEIRCFGIDIPAGTRLRGTWTWMGQ